MEVSINIELISTMTLMLWFCDICYGQDALPIGLMDLNQTNGYCCGFQSSSYPSAYSRIRFGRGEKAKRWHCSRRQTPPKIWNLAECLIINDRIRLPDENWPILLVRTLWKDGVLESPCRFSQSVNAREIDKNMWDLGGPKIEVGFSSWAGDLIQDGGCGRSGQCEFTISNISKFR